MDRPVFRCQHCSRSIFSDHGLARFNLDSHEGACLDQQARQESRVYQAKMKTSARVSMTSGMGSTVVPGRGQLGFPFDGVPEEVVA